MLIIHRLASDLTALAKFVIHGYAKMWFRCRLQPKATEAPHHYFEWMKELKSIDEDKVVKEEVITIFENGLYWLHSENLLLSALSDPDIKVRQRAVEQILRIRHSEELKELKAKEQEEIKKEKKCTSKKQRVFVKPAIDYEAKNYLEVLSWETQVLYEPPFVQGMTDEEVKMYESKALSLCVPSHSVQTERTIRDVDRVSGKSTSEETRDGMVRSILADRKEKPRLEKKSDFVTSTSS